MARAKKKTFTREHREGRWGRFPEAKLPSDSDAPIRNSKISTITYGHST